MLPQHIIPQLTTIPQIQPPGWEKVDRNRFTCTEPLQTTGANNKGICKGKTKHQKAIAKWGTCHEHDILKNHHTHTNVWMANAIKSNPRHGLQCQSPLH